MVILVPDSAIMRFRVPPPLPEDHTERQHESNKTGWLSDINIKIKSQLSTGRAMEMWKRHETYTNTHADLYTTME